MSDELKALERIRVAVWIIAGITIVPFLYIFALYLALITLASM